MLDSYRRRAVTKLSRIALPESFLRDYPGHYYSPIVSIPEALRYIETVQPRQDAPAIDEAGIMSFFDKLAPHLAEIDLPTAPVSTLRYYEDNYFGRGDAAILSAVIRELRPRRIIEVGSGFSSACALDTVDDLNMATFFTFIEPYPEARLHGLLRTKNHSHVTIHAKGVQDIDLSVFDELESGDLLFLDTTHVSKTGSDVNHELFQILPRLKSGVIIHFHDVFWGWEYPVEWVRENRSWNELYLLRAFLMHNDAYSILMFNDMMYQLHREKVLAASPSFRGPYRAGAGLYLRKR